MALGGTKGYLGDFWAFLFSLSLSLPPTTCSTPTFHWYLGGCRRGSLVHRSSCWTFDNVVYASTPDSSAGCIHIQENRIFHWRLDQRLAPSTSTTVFTHHVHFLHAGACFISKTLNTSRHALAVSLHHRPKTFITSCLTLITYRPGTLQPLLRRWSWFDIHLHTRGIRITRRWANA